MVGYYKKGLSKETIRILSERFKLNQEAFNRPYELNIPIDQKLKKCKDDECKKEISTCLHFKGSFVPQKMKDLLSLTINGMVVL